MLKIYCVSWHSLFPYNDLIIELHTYYSNDMPAIGISYVIVSIYSTSVGIGFYIDQKWSIILFCIIKNKYKP